MKKAILILTLVGILLAGCGKVKDGSSETTVAKSMTENDYNEDVEKLTDKSVYQTIVEDFDSDNNNEAFVLTRKGKDMNLNYGFLMVTKLKELLQIS